MVRPTMTRTAFLIDGVRSPFGRYGGGLAGVRADDLLAAVIAALVARTKIPTDRVDDRLLCEGLEMAPPPSLTGWVHDHCRAAPVDSIITAGARLSPHAAATRSRPRAVRRISRFYARRRRPHAPR